MSILFSQLFRFEPLENTVDVVLVTVRESMVVKGIKCGTKKKEREEGGEKTEIKIESSMRRMRMRERESGGGFCSRKE